MSFQSRHINRRMMTRKHVIICEDDLAAQAAIATHFSQVFDQQGEVEFSFVPGGMHAAGVFEWRPVDMIILDHDMPHGNGPDLLEWLRDRKYQTPVLTFSGLPHNNTNLMACGATHSFSKNDIIEGKADALIKQLLGV